MDKTTLVKTVAAPIQKVGVVLEAMKLQKDSKGYTEDHAQLIKETIAIMDAGEKNATDALKKARSNVAIATQKAQQLAQISTVPESVKQGLEKVVRDTARAELEALPAKIAEYSQETSEQLDQGLQGFVASTWLDEAQRYIGSEDFERNVRETMARGKSQN